MSCPRIEVDLDKIRRNTETVVRRLDARGIGVTGVTKAVCGHPAIAQAMLDVGLRGLQKHVSAMCKGYVRQAWQAPSL